MAVITERAYAKINLYLSVGARREDGFHALCSVMRQTTLYDEITFEAIEDKKGEISLSVEGDDTLSSGEDNLVYRAAAEYMRLASITDSISITLRKNIPIGAGLGGGSADCAAVLRALDGLYRALDSEALYSLGARLGSDVPFCMLGGTALCEGRGELLTPIADTRGMHIVIAMNTRSVSTPKAYAMLDMAERSSDNGEHLAPLIAYLSGACDTLPELYNSFDGVLGDVSNKVDELKNRLLSLGAEKAQMSGSGPSVFALFSDEDSARRALDDLAEEGIRAYYSN